MSLQGRAAAAYCAVTFALTLCLPSLASAAIARTSLGPVFDSCAWDHRGQDPYMGNLAASLDHYTDLAPDVRTRLQRRIDARDYDDMVDIRRNSITGRHRYDPRITDMHFGSNAMCRDVRRDRWTAQDMERGLVFCEAGQCVLVPTVCRNVSRITRLSEAPGVVAPADLATQPADELEFEPPAAGPSTSSPTDAVGGTSFADLSDMPPTGTSVSVTGGPPLASVDTPVGDADGPFAPFAPWPAVFPGIGLLPLPPAAPPPSFPPSFPPPLAPPPVLAVPEPSVVLTLPIGLVLLVVAARRRRRGEPSQPTSPAAH